MLYEDKALAAADPFENEDRRDEELHPSELEQHAKSDVVTIQKRDETAKVSWKPTLDDCTTAFEPGDVVLVRANADDALEVVQQPRVQGAVFTWNPWTGYVRAMVGGTDFDKSKVNRVLSLRQTGSTMTPIYYALAYDLGLLPSTPMSDVPYVEGGFKSTGGGCCASSSIARARS